MLIGGIVGVVVFGPLTAWTLDLIGRQPQGLAALLPVLLGAVVGSFLCGAAALWIAFREDDRRSRLVSAAVVLLGAPVLFFPGWELLAPLTYDFLSPQLVLAMSLVAAAIAGRWIAVRDGPPTRPSGGSPAGRP